MTEVEQATRKVVYQKDEIDQDEQDVGLGFLNSNNVALPGMCSTTCDEGTLWSPEEPYELYRPSFDTEYQTSRRRLRKSNEPQNYVKVLLKSDSELEKLSRNIRSQLRQSEMVELAVEAEKAALAGEESFSGKPSTFGGPKQDKLVPSRLKRRQTFTDGIAAVSAPYVDRKLKVLALRDVTEVIPHFRALHLHMRTHMRRRSVVEETLSFAEDLDSNERLHLQLASDLATQSMTFFENITDLSKVQQVTQRMIDRSGACSPALCDMMLDDDSQVSGASLMGRFGGALSSHLSPKSGSSIKRPPLVVPTGLSHPDEIDFPEQHHGLLQDEMDHSLLSLPARARLHDRTTSPTAAMGTNTMHFQLPRSSQGATKVTIEPAPYTASVDPHRKAAIVDSDDESIELGISLAQRTSAAALLDAGGNGVSSRPSTPLMNHDHLEGSLVLPNRQLSSLELTPKTRQPPKPDKHFSTPARLRSMRQNRSPHPDYDHNDPGNNMSTPETAKSTFEPSSIIDTGDSDTHDVDRGQVSSLHEAHAAYLALPSIQGIPSKQYPNKHNIFTESGERRKFRYPPRRTTQARNTPAKTSSTPLEEDQFSPSYSLRNDGNELDVDAKPDCNKPNVLSEEDAPPRQRDSTRWDTQQRAVSTAVLLMKDPRKKADERRQDDSLGPTVCSVGEEELESSSSPEHSISDSTGKRPLDKSCPKPSNCTSSNDEVSLSHRGKETVGAHRGTSYTMPAPDPSMQGNSSRAGTFEKVTVPVELTNASCSHGLAVDEEKASSKQSLLESLSWGMKNISTSHNAAENDFFPEDDNLQQTMSWPRGRQLLAPGAQDVGDASARANRTRNVDHGKLLSGIGFTHQLGNPNEPISRLRRFPRHDEGFQRAVEGMIANLSPTSSQKCTTVDFSDADNNEFLSNYFYCVKLKEEKNQPPAPENYDGPHICRDALCSGMGMETMLSGINFLFPEKFSDKPAPSKPEPVKARALSLGNDNFDRDDGWLGMLRMNSSRFSLHFHQEKDDSGDGGLFRFQPPCLKKSLKSSSAKLRVPEQKPSNTNKRFEKVLSLSKDGFLSMSNDERWNIIQSFSKESRGSVDDQFD